MNPIGWNALLAGLALACFGAAGILMARRRLRDSRPGDARSGITLLLCSLALLGGLGLLLWGLNVQGNLGR